MPRARCCSPRARGGRSAPRRSSRSPAQARGGSPAPRARSAPRTVTASPPLTLRRPAVASACRSGTRASRPTAPRGSPAPSPGSGFSGRRSWFNLLLFGGRLGPALVVLQVAGRVTLHAGELLVEVPSLLGVRLGQPLELSMLPGPGSREHGEPRLFGLKVPHRHARPPAIELERPIAILLMPRVIPIERPEPRLHVVTLVRDRRGHVDAVLDARAVRDDHGGPVPGLGLCERLDGLCVV